MSTVETPRPAPQQLDAHYPPQPAPAVGLGFNAHPDDPRQLALVVDAHGSTIRAGGAWEGVEDFHTGVLSLSEHLAAAIEAMRAAGVTPMLTAAYGPPRKHIGDIVVGQDTLAGGRLVPYSSSPWGTTTDFQYGHDFVMGPRRHDTGKAHGEQLTTHGGFYGSIVHADAGGAIQLGANLRTSLKAGMTLPVYRLRHAPPSDRLLGSPSRAAYKRYVDFLAQELATLAGGGYICMWNEPVWDMDKWVPGLNAFYEQPNVPADISGGGMHTLLREFFGYVPPAGVKLISGATDKAGADASMLKQYEQGVVGNIGSNYIARPTPAQLQGFVAEGAHPGAGLHQPEAQGWDSNFAILSPDESGTNLRHLAQRHEKFGREHGYDLELWFTEAGGSGLNAKDRHRAAVHMLRRVISAWGMGVPMPMPGIGDTTDDDGTTITPRPSYLAIKRVMDLKLSLGGIGGRVDFVPVLANVEGASYPTMTVPLYAANAGVLFAWQRSFQHDKTSTWYDLAAPDPATFTVVGPVTEAVNVVTGEQVAVTPALGLTEGGMSVQVGDEPIALIRRY